jgi:hypothetical protein
VRRSADQARSGRVLRRQRDRATRGRAWTKAIVRTAAAGRSRLGDCDSRSEFAGSPIRSHRDHDVPTQRAAPSLGAVSIAGCRFASRRAARRPSAVRAGPARTICGCRCARLVIRSALDLRCCRCVSRVRDRRLWCGRYWQEARCSRARHGSERRGPRAGSPMSLGRAAVLWGVQTDKGMPGPRHDREQLLIDRPRCGSDTPRSMVSACITRSTAKADR